MLRLVVGVLCLIAVSPIRADEREVREWIDQVGGHYTLSEAGAVTGVDLRSTWLTDGDLQRLAGLLQLENINLAYTKVTDLGLEHLIPLENVKVLDLYYAEYVTDLGIAHLKRWKNLEYLNARGTKVTSSLFEHISGMTKLRFLDVGHSRVNDDFFENLANLGELEHFSFGGNKMSGVAFPLLKLLPSLKVLSVAGQQRTDSGLWGVSVTDLNIESIAQLQRLEVLDLGQTSVSDRGVAKLTQLKNLHTLDLKGTRVTSKGVASLAGVPSLRHLRLWQCRGVDDTVVPALLQMQQLETLELPETGITAEGLAQLAEKRGLKQLLVGGVEVTPESVEAVRQAMPDCLVSWWVKPKIEAPARGRRGGD